MYSASGTPVRVLFVGSGSQPVLEPLAGLLKAADPGLHVATAGLTTPPNYAKVERAPGSDIDEVVRELDPRVLVAQRVSGFTATSPTASASDSGAGRPQLMAKALYDRIGSCLNPWVARALAREIRRGRYDLVHVHALFRTPVHEVLCRERGTPVVVSCWGSDILRTSDMKLLSLQQRVLRRADAITTTGPEFREIVLAKYGRDLGDRIHNTFFSPDLAQVVAVDQAGARAEFREKYSIPADALILCVGHNGSPEGQHVALVTGLTALTSDEKRRIHVVAPMTYGCGDDYRQKVAEAADNAGVAATVISRYMSDDEVAQLRCASEILLYAPTTDAFSASVSQALAVGAVCVVGSWLPYRARTQAGFRYWQIDAPEDSGRALAPLLVDWDRTVAECRVNRELSIDFFDPVRLGEGWLAAYHAAIDHHRETGPPRAAVAG